MRWWLPIVLVVVAVPAIALAKPKVAIAPLAGDDDGKVATVVVEEAAASAKVTGPVQVQKAVDSLGLPDAETQRSIDKLRRHLEVDAVIHGKVVREHGKKKIELAVSIRNKKATHIDLAFKKADSKSFRKALRAELEKRLADAESEPEDADDHAEAERDRDRDRKQEQDRDRKQEQDRDRDRDRKQDQDRDRDRDRDREQARDRGERDREGDRKRDRDKDADRRVAARGDDEEDDQEVHKRHHHKHHDDDDEAPPRHPVTQAAVWVDAGGAGLHRTLNYDATGNGAPPPVGTGSFSGELEGEVYPFSFDSVHQGAAGLGFFGSYGKTIGLSIAVPGTATTAPIDEGHYSIGARYRFVFGSSSIALGVSYWARYFIADRSMLKGAILDMPDVDYKAVAPGVLGKFAVAPKVALTVGLELPLMFASGEITSGKGFLAASIFAIAGEGGVEVALAKNYGLRFAGVFDQVSFSFRQATRGVSSATDRTIGLVGTFALIY